MAAVGVVAGVSGLVAASVGWDFKPLDPSRSMRRILPSVTVLVLGMETALSSLLLSVLALPSARSVATQAAAADQARRGAA